MSVFSLILILFVFCEAISASNPSTYDPSSGPIKEPYVNGLIVPLDVDLQYYIQPNTFNALRDVYFLLYTRKNPRTGKNITYDIESIKNSSFDQNNPTRLIIHGWKNDHTSDVNTKITAAYLNKGEFNVIVVDWGKASKTYQDFQASRVVGDVGAAAAKLIDFLITNGLSKYDRIVVVGHGLGAHAGGFVGKHVRYGKIKTIIGLDPVGFPFSINGPTNRLNTSDAQYVEVMHTSVSIQDPIGHSDFYPHYGQVQPGCEFDMEITGFCSFLRAYLYYSESLRKNNRFIAFQCHSYSDIKAQNCKPSNLTRVKMGGEPPNFNVNGIFYLEVNDSPPFAKGRIRKTY